MGGHDTIAQVHPEKRNALWKYSQESVGSKLVIGKVIEAIIVDDKVAGVKLDDGTQLDCDAWLLHVVLGQKLQNHGLAQILEIQYRQCWVLNIIPY